MLLLFKDALTVDVALTLVTNVYSVEAVNPVNILLSCQVVPLSLLNSFNEFVVNVICVEVSCIWR